MSVTFSKLSLRNARRQAKDYLVYFVTIVMAAALLYAFNCLVFSEEIYTLSQIMSQLSMVVVISSIIIVCIFGWLVSYAARFMLSRRSRELGTYILTGLEQKQVARLFFLENLAVGGCAMVLGLSFGNLIFQALRAIVLALFGQQYYFTFEFSMQSAGLTFLYFTVIYLMALRRCRRQICKMKIYDLIYMERQNEGAVFKTSRKRQYIFIVSVVFGILGTLLLIFGNLSVGMAGFLCIIVFLYGFFLTFASGVPAFFDKHPAKKYQGHSLIVFRNLTAKLSTMGILMATISLLFTATMITEGSGLVFYNIFNGRAAQNSCFDLYIGSGSADGVSDRYLDYIEQKIPLRQSFLYFIYQSGHSQLIDALDQDVYHYGYLQDPVIRYSDYAALRAIAGYETVALESGQYLIHCNMDLKKWFGSYQKPVTIGDVTLDAGGIYTEYLMQKFGTGNGHYYVIVVPDETADSLMIHHQAYAASTSRPVSEAEFLQLMQIREELNIESQTNGDYDTIYTKSYEQAYAASMIAVTVFPMYFLALALTMTAATILTIQQLSESDRYRQQFRLLQKLGMDDCEMARILRTQFLIYYVMPAIPPVLIGTPFILHLANATEPGLMIGASSPTVIAGIALGMFFLIYALYLLVAYISMKRNVLPDVPLREK